MGCRRAFRRGPVARGARIAAMTKMRLKSPVLRSLPVAAGMFLACADAAGLSPGVNDDVRFDGYSPLATTTQLLFREMSPLAEHRALALYADRKQPVSPYTLDIGAERFAVYVPKAPSPQGYGLLVFVPPWPQASIPRRWRQAFEETGTVFVTAANSGNDQLMLPRRIALAIHGYANVSARLKIDPERVYIGGMSGGARVALRIALGYADIFRGAILDAGSDAIGTDLAMLPAPPLLQAAQEHLRLVYLYGTEDVANEERARYSMQSAVEWCLPEPAKIAMVDRGHVPADATTMQRALRLQEPAHVPLANLDECRKKHEGERAAAVARVDALIAAGKRAEALDALRDLDARYAHFAGEDIQRLAEVLQFR